MIRLILLNLVLATSVFAQSTAVEALKRYIPLYDHSGINGLGQNCSIDMYTRSGGVMVELVMPRFHKFHVKPEMEYETGPQYLKISAPSFVENDGVVTNSLVFEGRNVSLERVFCKEDRCWTSTSGSCLLDRW